MFRILITIKVQQFVMKFEKQTKLLSTLNTRAGKVNSFNTNSTTKMSHILKVRIFKSS